MLQPNVGTVIFGRYRLRREIARGGMSSVWMGEDRKLKRSVAVKLMFPMWAESAEARARFEREAMAVAQLQSPHIVQIFDYGIDRECPFIVMEFLEGQSLRLRLKKQGRLSLEETSRIVVQTAKALNAAHAAGIIHRDLKPGNLFLVRSRDEELVKVLDFGVAKANIGNELDQETTKEGAILGTPRYMSPEQAQGSGEVDLRTDLWSLGVIAFRALTGKVPFSGRSAADVIIKLVSEPAPTPSKIAPDLSAEIDEFFVQALARDPDDRVSSAREFAVAFASLAPSSFPSLTMPGVKREIAAALSGAVESADPSWPGAPLILDESDTTESEAPSGALGMKAPAGEDEAPTSLMPPPVDEEPPTRVVASPIDVAKKGSGPPVPAERPSIPAPRLPPRLPKRPQSAPPPAVDEDAVTNVKDEDAKTSVKPPPLDLDDDVSTSVRPPPRDQKPPAEEEDDEAPTRMMSADELEDDDEEATRMMSTSQPPPALVLPIGPKPKGGPPKPPPHRKPAHGAPAALAAPDRSPSSQDPEEDGEATGNYDAPLHPQLRRTKRAARFVWAAVALLVIIGLVGVFRWGRSEATPLDADEIRGAGRGVDLTPSGAAPPTAVAVEPPERADPSLLGDVPEDDAPEPPPESVVTPVAGPPDYAPDIPVPTTPAQPPPPPPPSDPTPTAPTPTAAPGPEPDPFSERL